jgi:hypothetical protein
MDPDEARALLGVDPHGNADDLRSAYRRLLHRHHPDRAGGDGATTRRLTEAYRTLTAAAPPDNAESAESPAAAPMVATADDAVTLALPPDEAFLHLVDAAARIGAVTAVDPDNELLEALVTFDDGRTASLLISLQGRAATGTTDAFCTLEPLRPGDPLPPVQVVVDALAAALSGGG